MNVDKDLEAWITDRPRQRATRAATEGFALGWGQGTVYQRFSNTFDTLDAPSAERIAAAAVALFADDRWIDEMVDGLAARMRADPFFTPPFPNLATDVHNGLVVFQNRLVSIAAGVSTPTQFAIKKNAPNRGPTSVNFTGQVSVLKFVKAGGARLSLWEAPPVTAGFTAADAGQCRRTGERDLEDGEFVTIDGRHQSFVIERLRSNLVMVQASIACEQAPLSVEYDSTSGAFVGCSSTDDVASRIQMITTLLRKLDCDAALPLMAELLDHQDFFVRWHVMKEMLGLDVAASLPHLGRMAARDPHPDARRAARTVLDQLETRTKSRKAA